jgi:hypothetical protein
VFKARDALLTPVGFLWPGDKGKNTMRKAIAAAAGLGVVLCATAWAGVGVWSGQGPYGGDVFDVLQSPSSASTLYISTGSGIFKSTDSGTTWAPAMNGIVGSVSYGYPIAVDADAVNTLYAADSTGHFYRSTDGAANWMQTGYVLPPVSGVGQINQIVDGPGSTTRVYLVTVASGILVSNDSGATFTPFNGSGTAALPTGIPFRTLAVDPTNSSRLLAGTDYYSVTGATPSIYRSTDGGATWSGVRGQFRQRHRGLRQCGSIDLSQPGQRRDMEFGGDHHGKRAGQCHDAQG